MDQPHPHYRQDKVGPERFKNPIKLMSGNTRQVFKCRRHRIVYSFQQRSTRHGEIVQPRPKRRNCVAGFLPPPDLFLSVKHGDDDDEEKEEEDYKGGVRKIKMEI